MRTSILSTLVLGLALTACGGDPAITAVTLTPSTVAAGGTVNVAVTLENVELGALDAASALTARDTTARGLRAAHGDAAGMHLHAYFDNTESNPLVQTSSATFPVVIPAATAAGAHQLIVRLHNHDHTIYEPEVKTSAALTVQ